MTPDAACIAVQAVYHRVFCALKPRTAAPEIRVEFRRYASASAQIRLEDGQLLVRIADTLADAPEDVQEALAEILISKLYRRPVPPLVANRYRRYLNRSQVRKNLDLVRQARGRKHIEDAKGSHFDLNAIFDELNFRYFFGLMARPALGWSRNASRTLLGHYDSSHNAIVISKILDRETIPKLAVDYVMFHEMLHVRHPVEHRGGRRCVHTQAFKEAERQFDGWKQAQAFLHSLPG